MDVTPVKRVTVTDQILEQLGDLILTGALSQGEKLANERELSEMFGTTRARVREALRALALIGLIETKPGEGSFVSEQSTIPFGTLKLMFYKESKMFEELYEARKLMEPQIMYLASKKIKDSDLQALEQNIQSCEKVIEEDGSYKKFLFYINEFERIIANTTGNSVLQKISEVFIHMKEDANTRMYKVPGAMENSLESRKRILTALKNSDPIELENAQENFFKSAEPFYSNINI